MLLSQLNSILCDNSFQNTPNGVWWKEARTKVTLSSDIVAAPGVLWSVLTAQAEPG